MAVVERSLKHQVIKHEPFDPFGNAHLLLSYLAFMPLTPTKYPYIAPLYLMQFHFT
jgi:hypothetical protein